MIHVLVQGGFNTQQLLFIFFSGPHPWPVEVPRPGVESELQLPAYVTGTATRDSSHVCNLHYSLQPHWILNPLSETRDQTGILGFITTEPHLIKFCSAMKRRNREQRERIMVVLKVEIEGTS